MNKLIQQLSISFRSILVNEHGLCNPLNFKPTFSRFSHLEDFPTMEQDGIGRGGEKGRELLKMMGKVTWKIQGLEMEK